MDYVSNLDTKRLLRVHSYDTRKIGSCIHKVKNNKLEKGLAYWIDFTPDENVVLQSEELLLQGTRL